MGEVALEKELSATVIVDRSERREVINPPFLGMNSLDPPQRLPKGQGVAAYNVEMDEVIGIAKRSGYTIYNTASVGMIKTNSATIKEITGLMVYGSGCHWNTSVTDLDILYVMGNSSPVFWTIDNVVGANTMSLGVAYTQTVTASSYRIMPSRVNNLYDYKYGTTQKLIAFAGRDGYASTASTTGTWAAISAGLTNDQQVSAVVFQDKLIYANGYEFQSYDGSSPAAMAGSPSPSDPKYVGIFTIGNANFLWFGGSVTDASKSAFSFYDVNSITVQPAANRYFAGDRDGGVITGGKQVAGGFAVFKDNGIYMFSGIPGAGMMRKVISDVGCVAPYSLVEYEGVAYFIGRRGGRLGAYRFDGSSVVCLSDCIEPTLAALNQAYAGRIAAEIYDDKYVLSVTSGSGTRNDTHFICYINRPFQSEYGRTYWPWATGNLGMGTMKRAELSGTRYLFSGSPVNGFVYLQDNGITDDTTDNLLNTSSAINSYIDTAWYSFGTIANKKELLTAWIEATESGNWNVVFGLYVDFAFVKDYFFNVGGSTMTWAEVVYLSTPWQTAVDKSVHEINFDYPCFGRYFKFRWTNATTSQYFTVYPMNLTYKLETEG